jgi:Flp pilus assembly protein TadG
VAAVLFLVMLTVMDLSRYFLTMHSMRTVVAQAGRALIISPTLRSPARTCNAADLVAATGGLGFVASTGRLCVSVSPVIDPVTNRPVTGMVEASVELDAPFTFLIPVLGVGRTVLVERQRFRFAA